MWTPASARLALPLLVAHLGESKGRASTPVSSRSSRAAATAGSSPGSIVPAGNCTMKPPSSRGVIENEHFVAGDGLPQNDGGNLPDSGRLFGNSLVSAYPGHRQPRRRTYPCAAPRWRT